MWFVVDERGSRMRYTDGFVQHVWERTELRAKEGGVFASLADSPRSPSAAIERSLYDNLRDEVALVRYSLSSDVFEAGDVMGLSLPTQGLGHILG